MSEEDYTRLIPLQEVRQGKCYFRILMKFPQYANTPYQRIWNKYNKMIIAINYIAENEDFPERDRQKADKFIMRLGITVCCSLEIVVIYTNSITNQIIKWCGNGPKPKAFADVKAAAEELNEVVEKYIKE